MKIVSLNSFAIFMSIMALIRLSNTPTVEGDRIDMAECILGCTERFCRNAATECLPLGRRTGRLGIILAVACFIATGATCAICVTACVGCKAMT